jgi:hypothetical protein
MAKQAKDAYAWTESGRVKYGYYSPSVVIRHPDPEVLNDWADRIEREIASCGFGAVTETTNTIEAWRRVGARMDCDSGLHLGSCSHRVRTVTGIPKRGPTGISRLVSLTNHWRR